MFVIDSVTRFCSRSNLSGPLSGTVATNRSAVILRILLIDGYYNRKVIRRPYPPNRVRETKASLTSLTRIPCSIHLGQIH